jgi:hypothetical protein
MFGDIDTTHTKRPKHNIHDTRDIMVLDPLPCDEAFDRREVAQRAFAQHDNAFGRYIRRDAEHLTNADLLALSEGNNNLLLLAEAHSGMPVKRFLELVFEGWNTATAPAAMPKKATRNLVSLIFNDLKSWNNMQYMDIIEPTLRK